MNTVPCPGVLAAEAKKLGAWMVHYSTDYVFDGSKPEAYVEDDLTVLDMLLRHSHTRAKSIDKNVGGAAVLHDPLIEGAKNIGTTGCHGHMCTNLDDHLRETGQSCWHPADTSIRLEDN